MTAAARRSADRAAAPLAADAFPRNAWYPLAWSREIGRAPLARSLCGDALVLFRSEKGATVALEDQCVHRRAPLSRGRLKGDVLECAYHGLQYDCRGRCVRIPGQAEIPLRARVRAYPVVDKWRWTWVWMGEPAAADERLIPDVHWNAQPGWTAPGGSLTLACDWRLLIDNLLDLSHLTFLHAATVGNPEMAETPAEVAVAGDRVRVTRWMIDQTPSPTIRRAVGLHVNVDRWQIVEWTPPGAVVIDVGYAPTGTGAPAGDRSQAFQFRGINLVTPEGPRATRYLWSYARNFKTDDDDLSALIAHEVGATFVEDKDMLEAQQHNLDRGERATVDIRTDAGPLAARRILARLIAEEPAAAADCSQR